MLGAERPAGLLPLVERLTFLQLDPTTAIAPSADLVAWSRLGPSYDPGELPIALERDRTLFEHNAMVRPMSDLRLYLADMATPRGAGGKGWVERNDRFRRDVLDLLGARGPLMSRDIPDTHVEPWPSSGWTNNRNVTQMLELLAMRGEVAISGRQGRQRLWDLAERVYPPDTPVVPRDEAHRLRNERRLRALGIARAKRPAMPMEPVDVGDAGEPAVVEGVDGTWRVDPEALDRPFAGRTALLSPFDRLIHDRSRTAELFGFEYVLEMYKPAAKRRWGYFALPILHHDRLVGKLDATADRKAGVLRVNAVHRDVRFTRAITWGVDAEIASLAAWLGLTVEREAPAGRGHAPGAASRRSRNARSASLSVSLVAVEIEEHLHLVTSVARHGHDVRGSSRGRTAPVVSTAPTRQLPPEAIHAVRRSPRHGLRPDGTMDGVQIVRPPASSARLPRSVAACLAAILEIDVAEVPVPAADHPEPWIVWRNWLAQRGLGLVPIAEPQRFDWPGPWLAVLRAADGDGQVAAVAFGAPPGVAWHPADGPETFAAVEAGFVVAPADVALWAPSRDAPPRRSGTVEAIVIAPDAEGPMVRVQRAAAHAGRGLEGDRYFDDRGTFSNAHGRGHDLTLIEAEVLDALTFAGGRLAPEEARRNVVTRGIHLNALVGQRFRIGEVECFGQRLCEPCAHLEHLTEQAGKPGTLRALIHMGGLRVDLLSDGEIGVGAAVAAV